MFKFKVLLKQEILFTWIGIYPKIPSTHPLRKFLTSACTYFVLIHAFTAIAGSIVFAFQNLSQFDIVLKTCFVVISTCQVLGAFVSFVLKMNLLNLVHLELQRIVDGIENGIFLFVSRPLLSIHIQTQLFAHFFTNSNKNYNSHSFIIHLKSNKQNFPFGR